MRAIGLLPHSRDSEKIKPTDVHHRPHPLSRQIRRHWPCQRSRPCHGAVPRRLGDARFQQHLTEPARAEVFQVQEGGRARGPGSRQRRGLGVSLVSCRRTGFKLAGQSLGLERPLVSVVLSGMADVMKLSSKLFLLSAGNTLHALANTAFMRRLRREDLARGPDFASQRTRQASVVVQVVDGLPWRKVHLTFSVLDITAEGLLDVERLNTQQIARLDARFEPLNSSKDMRGPVINAASRFVARGGSWELDECQLGDIEAAALGKVSCPRVRVVL
jgi:hypothetical protein